MKNVDAAVDAIIEDIKDRRGLGDEWENIDDETREEIRTTWADVIRKHCGPEELGSCQDGQSFGPTRPPPPPPPPGAVAEPSLDICNDPGIEGFSGPCILEKGHACEHADSTPRRWGKRRFP